MRFFRKGDVKTGFVAFVVVLAAAAGVGFYLIHHMTFVTTDDAYIEGRIHMVASKVPGTVLKVYVDDNQFVKKGDPLLDIDPADYEVRVRDAASALEAQKARVAQAEALVSVAKANLAIQETALKQAGLDAARAGKLFAAGALSREKLEKTQTALALAQAQVKAAKEQEAQAVATKALEASVVGQREAGLETAKLSLSYTKITAPADGNVTKKSAENGNQVQPGQPLLAVVALDDLWIVANFKETQLRKVHPGQAVTFTVDTFSHKVFTGKVDSLMAGTGAAFSIFPAENALGNYVKVVQRIPVKITIDKDSADGRQFRVGMSVMAKIRVK
jgi:membrane fusion protein (multidrug efflux system)